ADASAALDHPLDACGDVDGRLASGRPVSPDVPAGTLGVDRLRRTALVVAVVPLHEVAGLLRAMEACKLRRAPSPLQRTAEHEIERNGRELAAQLGRLLLAALGERHVGRAGVPPG